MRILTLSNCQLRASEGSGQVILALTEGLRAKGHDVDLYGPDDFEILRRMRPRANSYRQTIGMVQFALKQLARRRYDMLEVYGGQGWLLFEALRHVSGSRPGLVSHSNGLEPHFARTLGQSQQDKRRWWQLDQSRWMARGFRAVDGLIVVSDFDRQFAVKKAYQPPDRVVTIRPGLHPLFNNLHFEAQRDSIVGFCGSWLPAKGIEVMSQALARALRRVPRARALLVGTGTAFHVRDWFPGDVAGRVYPVPWISDRATLLQLYRQMSICLVPSYYESFGLVAAEAMACSVAVIVSRNTGFGRDVSDGIHALVPGELTVDKLEDAILRLLSDEPLRQRIAAAGHQHVQGLRWDTSISLLDATYRTWFEGHAHPP